MMDHYPTHNPWATVVLSMLAGVLSWLADPVLWKALGVAAACGFAGGVFKAIGFRAWNKVLDRMKQRRQG